MLEIKGITVCYDRVPALKEVSINVKEKEVVALLGLNGTIINCFPKQPLMDYPPLNLFLLEYLNGSILRSKFHHFK